MWLLNSFETLPEPKKNTQKNPNVLRSSFVINILNALSLVHSDRLNSNPTCTIVVVLGLKEHKMHKKSLYDLAIRKLFDQDNQRFQKMFGQNRNDKVCI